MARSVNKVILVGNLGADPEIKQTGSGTKLAKLSLATSRSWGGQNGAERQEKTEWHRLTAFGKLADIVEQYCHKGDRLYIEGRIEYSSSGEGDQKKYFTDIVVNEMVMLGGGEGGAASRPSQPAAAAAQEFPEDDSLPF